MDNAEQQELQNVEASITQNKLRISRMESLIRLEKNKDFKELIADGFLEKHAIRQVHLKTVPGLQSEGAQKSINDQIIAIGGFKQFLIAIMAEGSEAINALEADEEVLQEMLAEDSE